MVDFKDSLTLPCGAVIKNRFFKSAMSEVLASVNHAPTKELTKLYEVWANGGSGQVITGNIMVDSRYLGEPRNLVIENEGNLSGLKNIAEAGTQENTHLWVQLNHPGKQCPKLLTKKPVAPSAIPLSSPGYDKFFAPPRELKEPEIIEIIGRFANAARISMLAGFTGVQIHGAHGYLVNQFLSPIHNQRKDDWGGSIEKRMRFVLEIYKAIRREVGSSYPIGIKLNSADFMKGGFSEQDSITVIQHLTQLGIDQIEISGGNYESPAFAGAGVKKSTLAREAYFLEFAEMIKKVTEIPIVVTGGFRTREGMLRALNSGATDMIGLGRPLAVEPDLPKRILAGEQANSVIRPIKTGIGIIDRISLLEITWYEQQMERLGQGRKAKPNYPPLLSLINTFHKTGFQVFQKRQAR